MNSCNVSPLFPRLPQVTVMAICADNARSFQWAMKELEKCDSDSESDDVEEGGVVEATPVENDDDRDDDGTFLRCEGTLQS